MTTYELTKPSGQMTLATHSPKEWAAETKDHLLALGCSPAYASEVARRIARAKPVA